MLFRTDESMAYPIRSPPIPDSNHNTSSCLADHGLESRLDTQQRSDSSWQDNNNASWNNWGRQQAPSQPAQPSVPASSVLIPQNFHPDSECYDTRAVSGKKFYRNIQSTPCPNPD